MGSFYRYSVSNLIGSGARGLIAPVADVASPVDTLDDIVNLTTLDPKTGWIDVGAAREGQGSSYERNIESSEARIEQATGTVWEDITDVPRSMTLQFAEFDDDKTQILEDAPDPTAVAAAAHRSPQSRLDFGSIESLTRYRVALVGMRREGEGKDITDEAADVRGPLVALVLHSVSIAAETATYELQRGQIANMPLTFRAFPDSSISDSRKAVGCWLFEEGPATIAAS